MATHKYTIDGVPVTPWELIDEARALDTAFDRDCVHTPARAANILRANGHEVGMYVPPEDNPCCAKSKS